MRTRSKPPTPKSTIALARSMQCAELGSFDGATDVDAKWVQVAREGQYLGYAGGAKPFTLTLSNMREAVTNLHQHPSFVAGPTGDGTADVIAWDYNHASEQDPTSGNLP